MDGKIVGAIGVSGGTGDQEANARKRVRTLEVALKPSVTPFVPGHIE
jgi:uncharacterized protein GlcG (DUF336 family)